MEPSLQTSFIPKQTISPTRSVPASRGGMGLLTVLSFVILVIAIMITAGAYGYKLYLQNYLYGPCRATAEQNLSEGELGPNGEIDRKCGLYLSLEYARERLSSDRLSRMEKLDSKMKLATKMLDRHTSLVPLFDILSTSTLKTIRYTKFETKNGEVSLDGVATGYEDIAVQSNILNRMPEIKNPIFGNLSLNERGAVTFSLKLSTDPEVLYFRARPESQTAAQAEDLPPADANQ